MKKNRGKRERLKGKIFSKAGKIKEIIKGRKEKKDSREKGGQKSK